MYMHHCGHTWNKSSVLSLKVQEDFIITELTESCLGKDMLENGILLGFHDRL